MDKNFFSGFIAFAGTIFTWLLGGWNTSLSILVLFMTLDYITGVLKAYVNKDLSSNIGFRGIARKCVIFIVLIVTASLDKLLATQNWMFRTVACYFYIANEGLSLIENCCIIGIPIPPKIRNALEQLKSSEDE